VVGEEAGMEIIEVNESDNLVVQREPEEDTVLVKSENNEPENDPYNICLRWFLRFACETVYNNYYYRYL